MPLRFARHPDAHRPSTFTDGHPLQPPKPPQIHSGGSTNLRQGHPLRTRQICFSRTNLRLDPSTRDLAAMVAASLELVGFVTTAVDGTRIQAVCSPRGGHGKDGLGKLLDKAEASVQALEKEPESQGDGAGVQTAKLPQARADEKGRGTRQSALQRTRRNRRTRLCLDQNPGSVHALERPRTGTLFTHPTTGRCWGNTVFGRRAGSMRESFLLECTYGRVETSLGVA